VAATDERAREEIWPHYQAMLTRIGAERGWPPVTREQFEHEAGPTGALFVGAPATVAAKIARTVSTLSLSRFNLKYSAGTLPHAAPATSVELYGTAAAEGTRAVGGSAHAAAVRTRALTRILTSPVATMIWGRKPERRAGGDQFAVGPSAWAVSSLVGRLQ
jgi:hypothetical protein